MIIDELIIKLQELPAEQRKLEAYAHAVHEYVPIREPVAEEREVTDLNKIADWSTDRFLRELIPQKKVMVVG